MRKASLKFFEDLCNCAAPSGFEYEATALTRKYVEKHCDSVDNDKMGSLIFTKTGKKKGPVILLAGHCDEIGFITTEIHSSGFLKFSQLGGWPDHVLLGQRVTVMTRKGKLPGVIAAKPIHLMSAEERTKLVKKESMFIDLGCCNADEAKAMGVRVGDPIVPDSTFGTIKKDCYKDGKKTGTTTVLRGKAFDNRAGNFVAAEVVRRLAEDKIDHPNVVVGAATVQEEVGLRGATTAGYMVDPDVCISLDVDIARDVPGIDGGPDSSGMGRGVSICVYDRSMLPNPRLKELVIDTADENKIPYALTAMDAGGQDGGAVSKGRSGCPSLYVGVPTRHIHSHVAVMDLADLEHWVELIVAVIQKLDAETVAGLTAV